MVPGHVFINKAVLQDLRTVSASEHSGQESWADTVDPSIRVPTRATPTVVTNDFTNVMVVLLVIMAITRNIPTSM